MEQPVKTVHKDGTQEWLLHGERHRDEAAALIWSDGTQAWYQHGKMHRVDGPAYIWVDGIQAWYQHGKIHRDDGPAWVNIDGTQEYWLNDIKLEEGSLKYRLIKERERRRSTKKG